MVLPVMLCKEKSTVVEGNKHVGPVKSPLFVVLLRLLLCDELLAFAVVIAVSDIRAY